ncbi:hypothetical protein SAMN05444166_0611 [Singulisphaera sp. GP187]|uniref:Ig-like domain-containing protein n=1 Tax=Singulisphaera sp. GP187 TaxID=1882752 RepID=UPI00092BFEB7|nr:Ig-like domain-containing protein [Singulisphaera sp. GP187]SIN74758.1 hypothetical protein SAMN05444166_0611 [Singulisphaera sp. GP187]
MFSLSVTRALTNRKSPVRAGSKGPHFRRCQLAPEALEGRQLLATGINGTLPGVGGGGADQAVAIAAFEANAAPAGTRIWTPEGTRLSVVQGELTHLKVAVATTNQSVGQATATIDWGDGVTTPGSTATYAIDYVLGATGNQTGVRVTGDHVYSTPGTFVVRTTIVAAGGDSTTVTSTVVALPSLTLSGALDPASDTGASNSDGITSATQPLFQGSATPGATVRLFATRNDGSVPIAIGQSLADGQGRWLITSIPLAEGTYTIKASGSTADGRILPTVALAAGNAGGPLVVDTTGPRIVGLTVDALSSQIRVSFGDNLSGLDPRGAVASNVVSLQRLVRSRANSIAVWPLAVADGVNSVLLGLSRPLGNGRYAFRILASGVRDLAGNALDGEFNGGFATGNGQPGGDFAATFQVARRQATAPRPLQAATTHPIHRASQRSFPGSSGLLASRRALRHAP